MTPGQILGAILLALAIGFGGAWQVQDWRMGKKLAEQAGLHKDDLDAISNAVAAQAQAEQGKRLALEQQLVGQDQQHSKKYPMPNATRLACVTSLLLLMSGCQFSLPIANKPVQLFYWFSEWH